ncbi:MAG: hypothetical protein U5K00_07070 [Melioribacteraceae bacterium]|nr:hypothetical protein [Melioribacteraceae bacterium]
MKYLPFLFLIAFLFINDLIAQSNILAKLDNSEITSEEFLKRFELTPRIRSSTNIDSQKVHFLYTLTAEKLWAEDARRQNLDTLELFEQYIMNLEKMFVRDALFKKEVDSKINITSEELSEAMNRKRSELHLKFLFSQSKGDIDSLYQLLSEVPVDSILQDRPERKEQIAPVKVVFGQMKEGLEDSLYNLDVNEYTKPIFNDIGWVIYYLQNKVELSGPTLGDQETFYSELNEVLTTRKKQKLMNDYLRNLLKDVNIRADGEMFQRLVDLLFSALSKKDFNTETSIFYLYEDDILKIINSVESNLLAEDFIKFRENPISFKNFLYYLYTNNFKSNGLDKASIRNSLNGVVREFIQFEIIARKGYKENLHLLPEIQNELDMWENNFLSQYLRNTYTSKARVTDSELEKHISAISDSLISTTFVSITEAKFNNLDEVHYLFSRMQSGESFEEVVQSLNLSSNRLHHSDSLKPISEYIELTNIIEDMEPGSIYGPVVRADGYSVIKLHQREKRELSFIEKNKLQIDNEREILFYEKLKDLVENRTIELAEEQDLQINENRLKDIQVTEVPALIFRYYGFGGQTVAAPFSDLFYDWFYKYQSKEKEAL